MLSFPDLIKERDGLKLAAALRDGAEGRLRAALAEKVPETAEEEAALIEAALARLKPSKADPARGGRPRKTFGAGPSVALKSGISLQAEEDGKGWLIRLSGKRVDRELVETTMRELEALLSSNPR